MESQMSCEEAIARILELLDRELGPADRHRMDRHLETCRGCFSRAAFERRLRARVAETGDTVAPESLRLRVRALMARF
jgi:anti-sigma factor (TIGR02949 family)